MEQFIEYAPWIVVIVIFLCQIRLFVRPEDLEKKHKKIIEEVDIKINRAGFMTPGDFEARRADFEKYIAENYISSKVYFYNHDDMKKETKSIKNTLEKIDSKIDTRNIEDRKMLMEIMQTLARKESK